MARCRFCDRSGVHPLSTCPWAVDCPTCNAAPGLPCRRPSGHVAARMHRSRVELAEGFDDAAGLVYTEPDPADFDTADAYASEMAAYETTRAEMKEQP